MKLFFHLLICVLALVGCSKVAEQEKLFVLVPGNSTGITFQNTLTATIKNNIFDYEYFYNGGGVAAADFNNDGLTDLFFSANEVSSKLYLNKGNLKFEDITEIAGVTTKGWCTGVAVVDINHDGWQDFYLCHAGLVTTPNQLFINQGKQKDGSIKFIEEAEKYGINYSGFTTHAAFFDYDKDGDMDLYLLNHNQSNTNLNFPVGKENNGKDPSNDKLYRNDGKTFSDVTIEAGITMEGFGLGISISDLNDDGWEDIYVANDFIFDDLIYINNKNGTFTESAHQYLKHTSRFSMGVDVADFNNDNYLDIIAVDMLPDDNKRQKLMSPATNQSIFNFAASRGYLPQYSRNVLQLNNGPDATGAFSFSEIGQLAGVYKTDWSWSPIFIDVDNDGWKDLFVSNGIPKDVTNYDFLKFKHVRNMSAEKKEELRKELLLKLEEMEEIDKPDFIFQNNKDLTFTDKSKSWGITERNFSNGAIYSDLDNDGDLEIITNNINKEPSIFINRSNELSGNNYLRIKLTGKNPLGSKVTIKASGKKQFIEHQICRGFQSSQENIVHFGLGKEKKADTLEVIWPDGKSSLLTNVSANQVLTIDYSSAIPHKEKKESNSSPLFTEITDQSGINFTHYENLLEEFNMESLLPHRFSRNGPYLAKGDIDKNGLEDFWIGGPSNYPAKIFLQKAGNKFDVKELPDKQFEDMGGLLFDCDKDGDLDLYVVSGGNEYSSSDSIYLDRLYKNDGQGNFTRQEKSLPFENQSGSCVKGNDFDNDGDIDLFVGGRLLPYNYPFPAESFILENDGNGKFSNITAQVCPELKNLGLVTSAVWEDFDNDKKTDLIVCGEWMPVTFFKNTGTGFRQIPTGLEGKKGWWFSLNAGDFDKDGDTDIIAGNLGLNSRLKASDKEPVEVHAKDFLGNKQIKPILSYYLEGEKYCVVNKDQLTEHLPPIRTKFITYQDFAMATFNDVFSKKDLEDAFLVEANEFSSAYLENQGNGKFVFKPLPLEAQFSTIQSILVKDYDHDGNLDILIGGNFYSPDFIIGQYDASIGLLLKGNGNGKFQPLTSKKSGIHFKGDTKSLLEFNLGGKKVILSASNQGKLQIFQFMEKPSNEYVSHH